MAPLVVHSLYGGDNAVVHCMTGLARGPMAASLLSAVAHNETLQVAMDRIERLRNTQLPTRAWASMGGKWATQAVSMNLKLPRYPVGFAAALTEAAVVHAVVADEEGRYIPLCKWKQGESMAYKREPAFPETIGEIRQYSHKFCRDCRPLRVASQLIEVERCFEGAGLRPSARGSVGRRERRTDR